MNRSDELTLIRLLNELAQEVHAQAAKSGFHDKELNDGEIIALIHSELSECLEGLRHGNPPDSHCPEFSSAEVELADTIIRILHYGARKSFQIGYALFAKARYNSTRAFKHGGKLF